MVNYSIIKKLSVIINVILILVFAPVQNCLSCQIAQSGNIKNIYGAGNTDPLIINGIRQKFVRIPEGGFLMGSDDVAYCRWLSEETGEESNTRFSKSKYERHYQKVITDLIRTSDLSITLNASVLNLTINEYYKLSAPLLFSFVFVDFLYHTGRSKSLPEI